MEKFWNKAKAVSDTITGYIAIVGFSFIYLLIFPVFTLMMRKSKKNIRTNWQPWMYKSGTIEECRKQY